MSKKICTVEGCTWPLFARGYCSFHYRSKYLAKKSDPKTPKKSYKIPKNTPKCAKQNKQYTPKRKLFIEGQRDKKGRLFCIFCGKQIYNEPSLHHGMGRDDESLLDITFWFLSHNSCHVGEYHSMSCKDIEWWDSYIERIKHIPEIIKKEQLRMDKS